LISSRMMEFGIYDASGYESTLPSRNWDLLRFIYLSKKPNDTNLLNLLNVKYIASHDNMRTYGYKKVNKTPHATIYLNTRCLPRAMLLRKVIVIDSDEKIINYISSSEFNPKEEIILEDPALSAWPETGSRKSGAGKDIVEIVKYMPREVEISVAAKAEAFLQLSDTYYPGWKAYVDGKEEKIYRANYFLRAVRVPQGEHIVKFVYDPLSFKAGAAISLITLLILILYLVVIRLRLTLPND
ncbi:MAG: YfhO family protein, partial [Candidatus Omnitrophica bacterium]|nr:YfhO family protein [Candidatus Omnitrophota bacterium]